MRILITDPLSKHALAIARYLKSYDPLLELIAASTYKPKLPQVFMSHYDGLSIGTLKEIIHKEPHDLLIPVGNASVEAASNLNARTAILPSQDSIKMALNKELTLKIAETLNIPIPKTFSLESINDLDHLKLKFPCVIKGVMEAGKNVVSYPKNLEEAKRDVLRVLQDPSQQGRFPIVQEYVPGTGLGFFGFYQGGLLKRFYMHQRIREFPISGGASTAARTIYHAQAFEHSKKLLDHLKWHGPAMVEFKYDPTSGKIVLMEINPKFWGSTELGLAAGVNFGELLVRAKLGEFLEPNLSADSYKKTTFYWPFEGDLAAIVQSRNWKALSDYYSKDYMTNVRTNGFLLNCFRLFELFRRKK